MERIKVQQGTEKESVKDSPEQMGAQMDVTSMLS